MRAFIFHVRPIQFVQRDSVLGPQRCLNIAKLLPSALETERPTNRMQTNRCAAKMLPRLSQLGPSGRARLLGRDGRWGGIVARMSWPDIEAAMSRLVEASERTARRFPHLL